MLEMNTLYTMLNLPDEIQTLFELYDRTRKSLVTPDLRNKFFCRSTWQEAVDTLSNAIGDDPDNLIFLWEELHLATISWDRYLAAGLPESVFIDTMKFVTRYLNDARNAWGRYRFLAPWWFPRELSLEEFRVGTLEYELLKTPEKQIISIHIPSDASLAPEAIDASFSDFRSFLIQYFPDWTQAPWTCDSWLLSPVLEDFLPATSRILAFAKRFQITDVNSDNLEMIEWVFPGPACPYEELPEKTSLQQALKQFLLKGGKPGWACGALQSDY